mgnify:FL=1
MSLIVKTAIGLCLAPIVGGMVGLLIYITYENITNPGSFLGGGFFETLRFSLMAGAMYGGLLGGIPSLLVGWPLHLAMQRAGWKQWWAYAGLGVVLALIAGFGIGPVFGLELMYFGGAIVLMLLMSGAIGGLIFWLIRRPDRDAVTAPSPPAHPPR